VAAVVLGVASAGVAGLAIGFLAIRTRGIYFSMVTLALGQIVYYAFYKAERWTGGENGLRGIQVPAVEIGSLRLDFLNPVTKYYVILAFVALALWFVSRILASPFGAVIEAVRENDRRAAACGYDVARTKLLVFVLSAVICGLAGALRALHLSIVPIDSLHYLLSGQAVMMCLLGGMGTFFGPFVGAGVFLTLEDVVTVFTKHWMAVVGARVHVLRAVLPGSGIWGTLVKRWGRSASERVRGECAVPILEVENVSKRFGNFVALNNVSTRFEAGKLSAIIGPNGAGKSTFFNVVSGAFPPSAAAR
jgi:branched-chain amino acid transport system permease protein